MSARDRAANVLGALALVITDEVSAAGAAAVPGSVSAAAALSALNHILERPTVDGLRRVLGLTHSGAVRLVDRLADAGLVTREPGADGRTRAVTLTPAGREAAERVSTGRAALLGDLLADLTPAEVGTLHELLGRVMAATVRRKEGGAWTCRLCDLRACGRPEGACPAANAAAERYGPLPGTPGATRAPGAAGAAGHPGPPGPARRPVPPPGSPRSPHR